MNISWMSRKRPTRPLMRYSLCPERYSRRLTTTSPGFIARTGLSAAFFFFLNLLPGSAGISAHSCASGAGVGSSEIISVASFEVGMALRSASRGSDSDAESSGALSITKRAASASSGSSMVMVTSASPSGGRLAVPLKMQSAIRSARSDLWLCSPRTQEMASTTLDLPQPLGPTMHVVPEPLKVTTVRSQNDLKPTISTFRSLSKMSPFGRQSPRVRKQKESKLKKPRRPARPKGWGKTTQGETTFRSSRGGSFEQQVHPKNTGIARRHVWQVLGQRPSRLAQGWRYGKKQ